MIIIIVCTCTLLFPIIATDDIVLIIASSSPHSLVQVIIFRPMARFPLGSLNHDVIVLNINKGGHCIGDCTPTRDRGQDLDPANFHARPVDHIENLALTLDYRALTTPIDRLERL